MDLYHLASIKKATAVFSPLLFPSRTWWAATCQNFWPLKKGTRCTCALVRFVVVSSSTGTRSLLHHDCTTRLWKIFQRWILFYWAGHAGKSNAQRSPIPEAWLLRCDLYVCSSSLHHFIDADKRCTKCFLGKFWTKASLERWGVFFFVDCSFHSRRNLDTGSLFPFERLNIIHGASFQALRTQEFKKKY